MGDSKQAAEAAAAQRVAASRRVEKRLINSAIRRAPRPVEPAWRPAMPSVVASGVGRNEADERAKRAAETEKEAAAEARAVEAALVEKQAAAKAALHETKAAEDAWWVQYLERKAEIEAAREAEAEAEAERERQRWRW